MNSNKKTSMKGISIRPFMLVILVISLTMPLPACVNPNSGDVRSFLLRSNLDIAEVSAQLMTVISSRLEETGVLADGYPIQGEIKLEADSSDPGVQIMHCVPGQQPIPSAAPCLLVNEGGDFIRAQAVTWESAAAHMYYVHVAPKGLFYKINPAKDFVGLDFFLLEDTTLWQAIDKAIREAAVEAGARPWR